MQESDRPGTSQVAVLGAAGLTLDATMEKILKVCYVNSESFNT